MNDVQQPLSQLACWVLHASPQARHSSASQPSQVGVASCWQPVAASQASSVQLNRSLQSRPAPLTQLPPTQ
jgi:hypothetical protein